MFTAGKANRGDPRRALVNEKADEEQMQQSRADGVRGLVAYCSDWFADGFHACSSLLLNRFVRHPDRKSAWCERPLSLRSRCCLDAGEGRLLLFVVAFDGQDYEAVDELLVGYAGRLP